MAHAIGADDVQRLVAAGAALVEVLPEAEYREEHIEGAIHIPLKALDANTAASLNKTSPVVVYCHDGL